MRRYSHPSPMTAAEPFLQQWCCGCKHGGDVFGKGSKCAAEIDDAMYQVEPCPLLIRAFNHHYNHACYPKELQFNEDDVPICTAFLDKDAPEQYRCSDTLDLFTSAPKE